MLLLSKPYLYGLPWPLFVPFSPRMTKSFFNGFITDIDWCVNMYYLCKYINMMTTKIQNWTIKIVAWLPTVWPFSKYNLRSNCLLCPGQHCLLRTTRNLCRLLEIILLGQTRFPLFGKKSRVLLNLICTKNQATMGSSKHSETYQHCYTSTRE